MAGIQTRGRGRTTTNKINQLKIQQQNNINNQEHLDKISSNKNYYHNPVPDQQLLEHKDDQGNYWQPYYESPVRNRYHTVSHEQIESHPIPTSGKLDQGIQAEVYGTESVIKKAELVERHGQGRFKKIETKPRTMGDPASNIFLGMSNTVQDYAGIVQGGYEDKSILNQSITKAIEGDWAGAGKLIQDNPYRFAGNLIVEAGSALIPVGAVLKVAKVAKVTDKILKNTKKIIPKNTIDGEEVKTLYRVTGKDSGISMWFSEVPRDFYHDVLQTRVIKYADDTGEIIKQGVTPQIRAVDVPKSVYDAYKVSHILKTGGHVPGYLKNKLSFAKTPVDNAGNFADDIATKAHDIINPKMIGEQKASNFIKKKTKQTSPGSSDYVINIKNKQLDKKIGSIAKQMSTDPDREWMLPIKYQNTERIVATAGQKESVFKRLLNPSLSNDKYTNKIAHIYKEKGYRKAQGSTYSRFSDDPIQHSRFSPETITPFPFKNASALMKKSNPNAVAAALFFTGTPAVMGLQSKNNAVQKGKEGQSMYEIKSAIAEEWDNPETRPGQWQNTTKYYYNKPGSPDTPYGDATAEGQDWAKSFWDTTPPRDERTWQQGRPSILWT